MGMFCAGSCLSLSFPGSAGGGLGLWVVQDRPARPSGRGRCGHAGAQPRRAWCGLEAGRGRSLPPRSGLRAPLALWLGPVRHPGGPGPAVRSLGGPGPVPRGRIRPPSAPGRSPAWHSRRGGPASPARRSAPTSALSPFLLGLSAVRLPGDRVRQFAVPRLRAAPAPRRARAGAHSHSPDRGHSCPALAIGGLRSAHRQSVTGRRWVAGTGAFGRPDDYPAGSGSPGGLAGALHRHGYPHVHSPACPHMHGGLTSVFTQIIHIPIHRALPLASQRATGEHESREKA